MSTKLHATTLAFVALAGCVTFFALDPYLDKAVGQPLGRERYPQLTHSKFVRESSDTQWIEYSIDSLWRCRWVFEVEKSTRVVKSWSYPNSEAKEWCGALPSSRP